MLIFLIYLNYNVYHLFIVVGGRGDYISLYHIYSGMVNKRMDSKNQLPEVYRSCLRSLYGDVARVHEEESETNNLVTPN